MRRINGECAAALRMTCVCLRYRSSISKLINALLSPYSHVHWRRLLFGDDAEVSFRLHCVVVMQILLQKQPDIHMIWMNSAVIKALSLLLRCNICLPRFFRCVYQQKAHYDQLCFQATFTRPRVVQSCVISVSRMKANGDQTACYCFCDRS